MGVPDLALTTNGALLTRKAGALKEAGLQRTNISLDTLHPGSFRHITRGRIGPVLDGIEAAQAAGLEVKLNAVVMRGINDTDVFDLLAFAGERNLPVRFLEMMPIGPAAAEFQRLYVSGAEIMRRMRAQGDLQPLPHQRGDTSRDAIFTDRQGRKTVCGFILPTSQPFCDGCRRLRLSADGNLFGCLAQPDSIDPRAAFERAGAGDLQPLRRCVEQALRMKQRSQRFREQRAMVRMGG